MKKINLSICFVLLLLLNCSRSYVKFDSENHQFSENAKIIDLADYTAYARLQKSENLYYKDSNQDSLQTEFQFMFLNKKNDSVIYISTNPSRNLYEKSGLYLLNNRTPNAHFFNHFYFGKMIEGNGNRNVNKKIEFKSRKENSKMEWNIQKRSDSIELVSINLYRTREIEKGTQKHFFANNFNIITNFGEKNKVTYKEIENYEGISISIIPDTIKVNNFELRAALIKENTQYLIVNYNQKKEIKNIEIIFDKTYENKNDAIRFKKGRILYTID